MGGYSKVSHTLLVLLVIVATVASARRLSKRSPDDDDEPRVSRQKNLQRLARRILEPPNLTEQTRTPDGAIVLRENAGDRQATLIHEDSGVQYSLINNKGNGTYEFGYDTRGGRTGARFFRHEERGADGRVRGQYGFVDANGDLHVIVYVTDSLGHRIRTETHKIEGYGQELSKILEEEPSSAVVKDKINVILREQQASAGIKTTEKPLITTEEGVTRTTRSSIPPLDEEPYFPDDDTEPPAAVQESSAPPPRTSNFFRLNTRGKSSRGNRQSSLRSRTFSSVNRERDIESTLGRPSQGDSQFKPSPRSSDRGQSTTSFIPSSILPLLFGSDREGFPESRDDRSFDKLRVPASTIVPPPEPTTEDSLFSDVTPDFLRPSIITTPTPARVPLALNIPVPLSSITPDQYDLLRHYLGQALRNDGGRRALLNSLGEKKLGTSGTNSGFDLDTLRTILRAAGIDLDSNRNSEGSRRNTNSDIIHGETINGGFIDENINNDNNNNNNNNNSGKRFNGVRNGDIINGGLIHGGFIDDTISGGGRPPINLANSVGKILNDQSESEGNIIHGEIIHGGIINPEGVDVNINIGKRFNSDVIVGSDIIHGEEIHGGIINPEGINVGKGINSGGNNHDIISGEVINGGFINPERNSNNNNNNRNRFRNGRNNGADAIIGLFDNDDGLGGKAFGGTGQQSPGVSILNSDGTIFGGIIDGGTISGGFLDQSISKALEEGRPNNADRQINNAPRNNNARLRPNNNRNNDRFGNNNDNNNNNERDENTRRQNTGFRGGIDNRNTGFRGGNDRNTGFRGGNDNRNTDFRGGNDNRNTGFRGGNDNRNTGFRGGNDNRNTDFRGGNDNRNTGFRGGNDNRNRGTNNNNNFREVTFNNRRPSQSFRESENARGSSNSGKSLSSQLRNQAPQRDANQQLALINALINFRPEYPEDIGQQTSGERFRNNVNIRQPEQTRAHGRSRPTKSSGSAPFPNDQKRTFPNHERNVPKQTVINNTSSYSSDLTPPPVSDPSINSPTTVSGIPNILDLTDIAKTFAANSSLTDILRFIASNPQAKKVIEKIATSPNSQNITQIISAIASLPSAANITDVLATFSKIKGSLDINTPTETINTNSNINTPDKIPSHTIFSSPDVLYYIPSPDLSKGRPFIVGKLLPTLAGQDTSTANHEVLVPQQPNGFSNKIGKSLSSKTDSTARSDLPLNAFPSLRGRAPVFINSTVIFTTTPIPNLGLDKTRPRLHAQELAKNLSLIAQSAKATNNNSEKHNISLNSSTNVSQKSNKVTANQENKSITNNNNGNNDNNNNNNKDNIKNIKNENETKNITNTTTTNDNNDNNNNNNDNNNNQGKPKSVTQEKKTEGGTDRIPSKPISNENDGNSKSLSQGKGIGLQNFGSSGHIPATAISRPVSRFPGAIATTPQSIHALVRHPTPPPITQLASIHLPPIHLPPTAAPNHHPTLIPRNGRPLVTTLPPSRATSLNPLSAAGITTLSSTHVRTKQVPHQPLLLKITRHRFQQAVQQRGVTAVPSHSLHDHPLQGVPTASPLAITTGGKVTSQSAAVPVIHQGAHRIPTQQSILYPGRVSYDEIRNTRFPQRKGREVKQHFRPSDTRDTKSERQ